MPRPPAFMMPLLMAATAAAGESAAMAQAFAAAQRAASAAVQPEAPPPLPEALQQLDYDGYRRIRFIESTAWWPEPGRWRLDPFHRGSIHRDRIGIFVPVAGGGWREQPFDAAQFRYDPPLAAPLPGTLGLAGFKLLHPLNRPGTMDEVAAFLDASYFRLIGAGHAYGASCRALAIRPTAADEEFPRFTAWWFDPPQADGGISLAATLRSPSLDGAMHLRLAAGSPTRAEVELRLLVRRRLDGAWLAPITSMHLWDGDTGQRQDVRGEVHDSDCLLVHPTSGPAILRPVVNRPGTPSFAVAGAVAGFGLLQRDRRLDAYHDHEAHYHRRPGLWIEPLGPWPAGGVRLIEQPSIHEGYDNLNAGFAVADAWEAGRRVDVRYRISAVDDVRLPDSARAADWAMVRSSRAVTARVRFAGVPASATAPTARWTGDGPAPQVSLRRREDGDWEVFLSAQSDLPATCWRMCLIQDAAPISEEWTYPWRP